MISYAVFCLKKKRNLLEKKKPTRLVMISYAVLSVENKILKVMQK